ncbi:MAG: prolipoprotein diacylglyceryl transferase [Oscillospiraceae bacterium]|nr:prolipoprotein diacylglyceryl transferase [Oscillospiraceae bacterium]
MLPFVNFLGREIPMYGLMFVLAAIVSIGFAMLRAKQRGIPSDDTLYTSLFAVIGAIVGAKVLYIITMIGPVIKNWSNMMEANVSVWEIIAFASGGFVFFGGLIGGIFGGIIYLRMFKLNIPEYVDLIAPCVPLAHAIGRVGCFFGGCCYGIETHYGVEFNLSPVAPHNVRLLPVQLIETDVNLLLVLILLIYGRSHENKNKSKNKPGKSLLLYLILYSVSRFTLEFFRGDKARGIFFGVSTSQFISIIIFFISVLLIAFYDKIIINKI